MAMIGKPDRGTVDMNSEECKGCGLCVEACPPRVLVLAEGLNRYGYRPAVYAEEAAPAAESASSSVPNLGHPGVPSGRRLGEWHAKTTDQRQRGHRQGRRPGRMPRLLRIPDYSSQRDRRSGRTLTCRVPAGFSCRRRARWPPSTCCTAALPAGVRCMTASSGPGISLMQEGFSYLAGAELPCVIADIMRGGPGLGNIAPEQSDYNQIVKGGGTGTTAPWWWHRIRSRKWPT